MESELIKAAAPYGIGMVLFIVLFVYMLKSFTKREERAENREDKLMVQLNKMNDTHKEVTNVLQLMKVELVSKIDQLDDTVEQLDNKVDKLVGG